jgi:hypothetical protein
VKFSKQTHAFRVLWHNNCTSVCLFCNLECRWFHQSMLYSDWSSKQLIIVSHNAIVLDTRQWIFHRAYPCYETLHPCCAKLIVCWLKFRTRLCLYMMQLQSIGPKSVRKDLPQTSHTNWGLSKKYPAKFVICKDIHIMDTGAKICNKPLPEVFVLKRSQRHHIQAKHLLSFFEPAKNI